MNSNAEKLQFIRARIAKFKKLLNRKVAQKKNQFQMQYGAATGKELPKDVLRNHKAIQQALENYRPEIYNGHIVLFRATDQPRKMIFEPYLGWQNFTSGEITVAEVTGAHGALTMYPYAAELAEKFQPFLVADRIVEKQSVAAGV